MRGKSSNTPKSTTVYAKSRDIIHRRNIDGSIAVLRLDNDKFYFVIDGVAADAWDLLNGRNSVATIVKRLTETSDMGSKELESNLAKFIASLKRQKLIQELQ